MTTTTLARDSAMNDEWLRQAMQMLPCKPAVAADGTDTGEILSGIVRLSFPHLFTPRPNKYGVDKYSAAILWPHGADLTALDARVHAVATAAFPSNVFNGRVVGLKLPLRDQEEQAHKSGFLPGARFCNAASSRPIAVVDTKSMPITDHSKVYGGVWAVVSLSPYAMGNGSSGSAENKGVAMGLQSVMIVADDTPLGGGGAAAATVFGGLKVPIAPPTLAAAAAAARAPAAQASAAQAQGTRPSTPYERSQGYGELMPASVPANHGPVDGLDLL